MQLYDKIRVIRELKNWTQEEITHRLEMSISGYGSIERGETDVNFSQLEKIAKAFEMDLIELLSFGERFSIYQTNNSGNNEFKPMIRVIKTGSPSRTAHPQSSKSSLDNIKLLISYI